jgi:chaperonin GroES
MTIKPIGNRVLVSIPEKKDQTESGIFLANMEEERPEQGSVVAVGASVEGITIGDSVYFKKYAPDEVQMDGVTYFILSETDVLAIVR